MLDAYSPFAYGGTGEVFNWDIAIEAKKYGKIILAGGLSSNNVKEAINKVHPYGVDVSSSVEKKGIKEEKKIKEFIYTVKCSNY